MSSRLLMLASIMFSFLCTTAIGAEPLSVDDAWARATPPNAKTAAVYLRLSNQGDDVSLAGAISTVAREGQVHEHTHVDGMMRMQRINELLIPSAGSVELKPGGYHLMLIGLSQPLLPGSNLKLELQFIDRENFLVTVPVIDARKTQP